MKIIKTAILKVNMDKPINKIEYQVDLFLERYGFRASTMQIGFLDDDFIQKVKTLIITEL